MRVNSIAATTAAVSYTGSIKKRRVFFKQQPAIQDEFIASKDKTKEINKKAQRLTAQAYEIQENIDNTRDLMEYELIHAAYNIEKGRKDDEYNNFKDKSRKVSFHPKGSKMQMKETTKGTIKTTTFDPNIRQVASIKISSKTSPDTYDLIINDTSKEIEHIYLGVKDNEDGSKKYHSHTSYNQKDGKNTYIANGEEYPDGKLKCAENIFIFKNRNLAKYIEKTDEIKTDKGSMERSKEVFEFNKEKAVLYGTNVITDASGQTTYGSKYEKSPGIFSKFKKVI